MGSLEKYFRDKSMVRTYKKEMGRREVSTEDIG